MNGRRTKDNRPEQKTQGGGVIGSGDIVWSFQLNARLAPATVAAEPKPRRRLRVLGCRSFLRAAPAASPRAQTVSGTRREAEGGD